MRFSLSHALVVTAWTSVMLLGTGVRPSLAHGHGGGHHGSASASAPPGVRSSSPSNHADVYHGSGAGARAWWPSTVPVSQQPAPVLVPDDLPEARLHRFVDRLLGRPPRW